MKNNSKPIFRWQCHHDAFHGKDRECCHCKGELATLKNAVECGKAHNQSHRWTGWGYPPLDWKNETVNVYRKTPTGKLKLAVGYDELNQQ